MWWATSNKPKNCSTNELTLPGGLQFGVGYYLRTGAGIQRPALVAVVGAAGDRPHSVASLYAAWLQTLLIFAALSFSVIGAIWMVFFLGYDLSAWVGIIAIGVDAETSLVMLHYQDEAYLKRRLTSK